MVDTFDLGLEDKAAVPAPLSLPSLSLSFFTYFFSSLNEKSLSLIRFFFFFLIDTSTLERVFIDDSLVCVLTFLLINFEKILKIFLLITHL